jgi:hypothetical protein
MAACIWCKYRVCLYRWRLVLHNQDVPALEDFEIGIFMFENR